jgi:phospholipase C
VTSKRVTRRNALKSLGATAALPVVTSCGDDSGAGGGPAVGEDGITRVVVLMMENRSYDHYLGSRSLVEGLPGDGLTAEMANPDAGGTSRAVYRESTFCVADPPHGWDSSHLQFNAGMNDGFLTEYEEDTMAGIDPHVMGYFVREDLPVTYALADTYTSCDRYFCSVMGPTWPNRFYFHCAQSEGLKSNDSPQQVMPTIYDRMTDKGFSFGYFYTDLPFLLLVGGGHPITPAVPSFFDAAANGTLPNLTVIDPGFALNDDHPPHHPQLGQQFIASIYQALATSPQWKNVLFIVTYDEHGGFFDHVAPPTVADDRAAEGFDQLGFRVPTLVIGPYVKAGHVSSVQYDHTSILKHIETLFDLEPLTARDAAANDLSDAIDADRLAALDFAEPITLPTLDIDPATIDPACKTELRRSEIEIHADEGKIDKLYDLRPQRYETARFIAEYLERHGVARIKRG